MAKFNCFKLFLFITLLALPVCSLSALADTTSSIEVIRSSNTRILTIYQSSPVVNNTILEEISSLMDKVTDFETMAARTVQKICQQSPTKLCTNLKEEFIKLLKLTATRKLGRYRAERFEYLGEEVSAKQAIVRTIAYYKEDSIQLDYILEKKDGKWLVVNYIGDGVDTIQNYQSQFSRLIQRNPSVESLVKRLKNKNEQYRNERTE